MTPEMLRSLAIAADLMPADGWWIIGSTALALSGVDVAPKDLDILGSAAVIEAARVRLGATGASVRPGALFRSEPYFQYTPDGGCEIDFMGDMELCTDGMWSRLHIESRISISVGNIMVFTPTLEEQVSILHLFGRPKDLARAALAEAVLRA